MGLCLVHPVFKPAEQRRSSLAGNMDDDGVARALHGLKSQDCPSSTGSACSYYGNTKLPEASAVELPEDVDP